MANGAWLRCRVDKGMFPNEAAVTYPAQGEPQKSVFVPRTEVAGEGDNAIVRVMVRRADGSDYAKLPTQYSDVVRINPEDLVNPEDHP